jgi:YVTN family beta-propeller protein
MKSKAFAKTLAVEKDAACPEETRRSAFARTALLLLRAATMACVALLAGSVPTSAQIVSATVQAFGAPGAGGAVALNPVTNKIYVADEGGGNVLVIDGATNASTQVSTGSNSPKAIAVNPVTNKIYAANQNTNFVSVIDGATNTVTMVGIPTTADAVVVNPVTNKIYVASQCDPNAAPSCGFGIITVIDGVTNTATTVSTGNYNGHSTLELAVNQVTNKVYLADSTSGALGVTVLDGATNNVTTITAGNYSYAVAVNSVTNTIYAANQIDNTVTVIDGATNKTTTLSVGKSPSAVAVNPVTNKIYVANFGDQTVTVIDGANNTTSTVGVGLGPTDLAVNLMTNQVYVANYDSATVSVIDGATNTATTTLSSGALPVSVAVNPVTNRAYVANYTSNSITVIDGDTNATSTVSAGSIPNGVAADPVTNKVYVATSGIDSNITVIDRSTNTTFMLTAGNNPGPVAVNPVTSKVYVGNTGDGTVTVIDETTSGTSSVTVGSQPSAVAVNAATNQVYVTNQGAGTVTVIDGASSNTTTVTVGSTPSAVAVNAATNQVYVTNQGDGTVTVIDGASSNTTTVTVGSTPSAVAVNAATNQVYVTNNGGSSVSVIDGVTNATTTVPVGTHPVALAVDPAANEIYVANQSDNTVTVIDGGTNATSTDAVGSQPYAVAVNSVTGKVYVSNHGDGTLTVMDGARNPGIANNSNTRSRTTVSTGSQPSALAVNPASNEIFIANQGNSTVTVLDEQTVQTIPLQATVTPLPNNTATSLTPTLTFAATSGFFPIAPAVDELYYQADTWQGPWLAATSQGAGAFSGATPTLQPGFHVLYFYATDSDEATAGNHGSPLIGNIGAYGFLALASRVTPTIAWPTPASITYGTALSGTQLNATASVPGTFEYSPGTGTVLSAGTQTLSVTFTPTDTTDYTTATATVTLVVNQATPTISWATPAAIIYGTQLSSAQLDATASVPGTFSYSPAASTVLSVGNQTLSVTFTPTDTTDYTTATATVSLIVSPPAPTITSPTSGSITMNSSVTVTGTGTPGASVSILDGTTPVGTSTADSGGNFGASLTLAIGPHTLTATQTVNGITSAASPAVSLSVVAPPPVIITDNETITVTDTVSFPDVFDAESIKVSDQVIVHAFFPIAISPAPPILSAVQNKPYSGVTFSGTGGYLGLTLSETGAVPGMTFSSSGATITFSGTPTQTGSFPFTVTATDSIGNLTRQNYSLMVSASCPAISVSPMGSLGILTVGSPFSQMFTATGGVGTITWSTPSALPNWMTFSAAGVLSLSGTPLPGTISLNIVASDQNGCQSPSTNVSLLVVPPPAVITDNETITVTDTSSFPDVFDSEQITVTDQVTIHITNSTATSISAPGVTYGTPAVATVSVSSPTTTVTGNVTLSVDGGTPLLMGLSSGSATFSLGLLNAGPHSLAANFAAQDPFNTSNAISTLTVSQATPVLTWPVPAAITYGIALSATQLNATASVAGTFVYSPPAGTVLSAGSQTLSVTFAPKDMADYTTATATVTLSVNQVIPTTVLSTSAATIQAGQPVTFTAAVTGASPTGTVQFKDGASNLGSPVTLSASGAQLTTSALTVGVHSITAVYSGDANNAPSTSTAVTETVTKESSTTALSTSAATIQAGQPVTFTATVTGASPTGTVQFMDGATNLSSAVTLSGGSAQLTTSTLTVGGHSITAAYSGDANNSKTTSAAVTETVTQESSTTALSTSAATIQAGQPVKFTATVTGASPTGTVQFKDLPFTGLGFVPTNLGSPVALSAGGNAQLTTSALTPGIYTIYAVYSGDANNSTSSATVTETVTQPVLSPSSLMFNSPLLVTSAAQQVTVTNAGTVPLVITSINVAGANAGEFGETTQCPISPASLQVGGSCVISVTFTPTSRGTKSAMLNVNLAGPAISQSVSLGGTVPVIVVLTTSAATIQMGQPVTFTATVTGVSPTGTVQFEYLQLTGLPFGPTNLGSPVALSASGSAQLTTSALTLGSYTITAVYSGDANNSATTSNAVTETVIQPVLSLSPSSLMFNSPLSVTSAAQQVTVTNAGTVPLVITSINVAGANAGEFGETTQCPISPASLQGGGSCVISVTFTPTSRGTKSAMLNVNLAGPAISQSVSLGGTVPVIVVLTTSAATIQVGQPVTFTATVTGVSPTGTVQFVDVPLLSPIPVYLGSPVALSAGGSAQLTTSALTPGIYTIFAMYSGDANNSARNSNTVTETVTQPVLSLSPSSLTFNSPLLVTSAAQQVTVTNAGTAPLVITSINVAGANAGEFGETTQCPISPASLQGGGSCVISVTFTPTSRGAKTAMLNVNVAGPAISQSVSLAGTVPVISVSPIVIPFGNQARNTSSVPRTITVRNTGTGPLLVKSISISMIIPLGGIVQFHEGNNCPILPNLLPAGGSCTITVVFDPISTGPMFGGLTVTSDALTTSAAVALTGRGIN